MRGPNGSSISGSGRPGSFSRPATKSRLSHLAVRSTNRPSSGEICRATETILTLISVGRRSATVNRGNGLIAPRHRAINRRNGSDV